MIDMICEEKSNFIAAEEYKIAENDSNVSTAAVMLAAHERIDDLQLNGLRLIQSTESFRFGTDSVLLSHFARVNRKDFCVDLGAGAGALSFLLHGRTGCRILGIEIDALQTQRFLKSVALNGLDEMKITAVNADYIEFAKKSKIRFDCAICNPPYYRRDCGALSKNVAATHDITAPMHEIAEAASKLLRFGGKFFMCFPAGRLSEAFVALSSAGLEPKRLRLAASKPSAAPYLALIEAKKGAKSGLIIEKNLVIYDENGEYSPEVAEFYGK